VDSASSFGKRLELYAALESFHGNYNWMCSRPEGDTQLEWRQIDLRHL
jgi:hypothetical protein